MRTFGLLGAVGALAVAVILVIALAPSSVVPPGDGPSECTSDRADQPACNFSVSLVNRAASFDLAAVSGPTLIKFMGSFCTTCEAEMPHLNEIYSTYGPQGLSMISLDIGGLLGTENPQDATNFMTRTGGQWDYALDNDGIALDYGIVSVPTIFLVDGDGTITYRTGFISAQKLSEHIEPLL